MVATLSKIMDVAPDPTHPITRTPKRATKPTTKMTTPRWPDRADNIEQKRLQTVTERRRRPEPPTVEEDFLFSRGTTSEPRVMGRTTSQWLGRRWGPWTDHWRGSSVTSVLTMVENCLLDPPLRWKG
jgi:hypothetical protein